MITPVNNLCTCGTECLFATTNSETNEGQHTKNFSVDIFCGLKLVNERVKMRSISFRMRRRQRKAKEKPDSSQQTLEVPTRAAQ
jgi:hypothetical protein